MDIDVLDKPCMEGIIPHEHTLDVKRIRQYMKRITSSDKDLGYEHPLPVIRFAGQEILCEGHHTLAALYLLGYDARVFILRNDADVMEYAIRSYRDYVSNFDSIKDLIAGTRDKIEAAKKEGVYAFPEVGIKFSQNKILRLDDPRILEEIAKVSIPKRNMSQCPLQEKNLPKISA